MHLRIMVCLVQIFSLPLFVCLMRVYLDSGLLDSISVFIDIGRDIPEARQGIMRKFYFVLLCMLAAALFSPSHLVFPCFSLSPCACFSYALLLFSFSHPHSTSVSWLCMAWNFICMSSIWFGISSSSLSSDFTPTSSFLVSLLYLVLGSWCTWQYVTAAFHSSRFGSCFVCIRSFIHFSHVNICHDMCVCLCLISPSLLLLFLGCGISSSIMHSCESLCPSRFPCSRSLSFLLRFFSSNSRCWLIE